MFQTKEGDKTPEEEPTEAQIDKLPEKEFQVRITKMIKECGRRVDEHGEKLNRVRRYEELSRDEKYN